MLKASRQSASVLCGVRVRGSGSGFGFGVRVQGVGIGPPKIIGADAGHSYSVHLSFCT
jgi:hypothetical protein